MAKIQIVPRRSFTTTTQSWPSTPRLSCHGQSSCQILIYPTFGVPQLPKWSLITRRGIGFWLWHRPRAASVEEMCSYPE